jgi:hypothetical protein
MRFCRLILAGLLAASVALLPVSAAMAMTHAAKAEMSMSASGDDCPCCKSAQADACPFTLCSLQAISVDGPAMLMPTPACFAERGPQILAGVSLRPTPPPPRS